MRTFILLTVYFIAHSLAAQPEFGLPFQSHLPQAAIQVNPGIFTDHKVNLALPGLQGAYVNSAFQWADALKQTPQGQELDLDPVLKSMSSEGNVLRTSLSFSAGSLTFRLKDKHQLSFFHNTHFDALAIYPKGLPSLLWKGNGAFVGQEVQLAPRLNLTGYSEYGFGFATRANDKAIFGFNLKYVNGFLGMLTSKSSTLLRTDEEYYQLTFTNDMQFFTAGLNDIFDGSQESLLASKDPMYYLTGGSKGFSVDMGMTYQVNQALQIQFALQDFGFIEWDSHVLEHTSKGVFEYKGQVVRPFANEESEFDFDEVRDSLGELFEFTTAPGSFLTNFPIGILVGGNYEVAPDLRLGASFHFEHNIDESLSSAAFAFHLQKQFGNVLYLGAVAGYYDNIPLFGASSTLQLGPVQLFFMSDNIVTLIEPKYGRSTNFRTGMNLSFLRDKKVKM